MFAVTRLRVPAADVPALTAATGELLAALRARPGFRDGELGRAADDPELFALCTRWDGVGAYRRALSAYEVKVTAVPLLSLAIDEPTAFEDLLVWTPADGAVEGEIALAADAGRVSLGEAGTPRAPRALD
jgi:hypothetical protein